MTIWYICVHLVHFSGFGILYQEKSGNPGFVRKLPPKLIQYNRPLLISTVGNGFKIFVCGRVVRFVRYGGHFWL
jgi:hypothetical protein